MVLEIANALVPFFFSMGAGFFAEKVARGKLPVVSINTMLMNYALPFALFVYTTNMKRESFASHILPIFILAIVMLVPYFISLSLSKFVFGVEKRLAAVRSVTIGMPNFAAVGLPLLHAVYGEQSTLTVALAITIASVVMSPACLILLEQAKTEGDGQPKSQLLLKALRNTFLKPVVIAPLAGLALALAGWHLPSLASQSLTIIGNTTAGLALFSTGMVLAAQPFKIDLEVIVSVLLSNVGQPLLAWLCTILIGLPAGIAGPIVLLAAIPCGSFGILFGLPYGVKDSSAGTTLVASSLLSALSLSAIIYLLAHL
jgi:malonate transporter and related proteins